MNDDRERTYFAALLATVGAVVFVAGALLAKLAHLFMPWGFLLMAFGGVAVLQAVLIGLGVSIPGEGSSKERR